MVHGLAEQSGGRLRVTSRIGEGATAEVWLPAAVGPGGAPERAPEHGPQADLHARPLRILAVDDDDLVLMNTCAMLEDLGHEVLEAHSGAQALQILRKADAVDLMVTDQAMPNMTGLQLAETALDLKPGLAVILATGYAELPPGADPSLERLAKPFTQGELAEAVVRAVGEQAV
jgi:CheY-like chemotaxis protein